MTPPTIAVIGLGTMGLGIAQVFAQAGHRVLAHDAHAPAHQAAPDRWRAALMARLAAGRMAEAEAEATLARLIPVAELADLAPAALMIEAIAEDLEAKRALFAVLAALAPGAVLASNTSSLRIARIAAGMADPARVIGLHFFNPAPAMRLVELIAPSGPAADLARGLCEAAGKVVVAAPDSPGFIVNRCARPFYGEALALLAEGRAAAEIDAAMQGAGYRLGPFALIDLIGADINLAATRGLAQAMGGHPRYHVFPALEAQVAAGALGRKAGRGFVTGQVASPPPPPDDADEIVARIEAALVNEALWLAHDSATPPEAIDPAVKLGLNFPRGPFEILAAAGRPAIAARLATLEAAAPPALKTRYLPPPEGPR